MSNAVAVPGKEVDAIGRAAREAGVAVAIGVTERNEEASRTSLYNSLLFFDRDGRLAGRHRKLVPTGGERLVWAGGDAAGLRVHPLGGARVGGLICWENYMPLARFALCSAGLQIYLAPTWDHGEAWLATLRHIAREGRVHVVGCSMALRTDDIPADLEFSALYPAGREWINPGGNAILDPSGALLAGPLEKRKEILFADLDLEGAPGSRWDLDVAGHYARPDIFRLEIDRDPRPMLTEKEVVPKPGS